MDKDGLDNGMLLIPAENCLSYHASQMTPPVS